jgi:hypothetical protein
MNELVLSKHAVERITEGDEYGIRTKLTLEEISQIFSENKHLVLEDSIFFFSDKDYQV